MLVLPAFPPGVRLRATSTALPAGVKCFKSAVSPATPTSRLIGTDTDDAGLANSPAGTSNEVCVFKRAHYGGREQLIREIQLLQQISENWEPGHANCPAVPRILGLVTSRDQIAGILEEFIDGEKLSELDMEDVSTEQRQKWKQVQHTITLLHPKNFVWGDVKPDNVLIDKEARAWLIDFGGSWTDGWVDEHLAETIEGDLQGLDRLKCIPA